MNPWCPCRLRRGPQLHSSWPRGTCRSSTRHRAVFQEVIYLFRAAGFIWAAMDRLHIEVPVSHTPTCSTSLSDIWEQGINRKYRHDLMFSWVHSGVHNNDARKFPKYKTSNNQSKVHTVTKGHVSIQSTNFQPIPCCTPQREKFMGMMGPTWGPPGPCRPQMDPMLAPWTLLSGSVQFRKLSINAMPNALTQNPASIMDQQGKVLAGPRHNIQTLFSGIWITVIKIRRSWDHLIFIMGITILMRRGPVVYNFPNNYLILWTWPLIQFKRP